MFKRTVLLVTILAFLGQSASFGSIEANPFVLPAPGVLVHLSPVTAPPVLKGIKVYPQNPFRFDFILNPGEAGAYSDSLLKAESAKLVKYFLASLTVPEDDLWVNLSPYEKNRMVPESFGQTQMGRDLLAEDYILKQVTATLIYPEDAVGKEFWSRVYKEAAHRFGTTNIPVNTFNKVWIVPDKALIYESPKASTAYIIRARLKVMLEQDYLSLSRHTQGIPHPPLERDQINALGSQIVRDIVLPQLTREVNTGGNFAVLRQVYNSLILAAWYKKKIRASLWAQVYENKNKITGVRSSQNDVERIYADYLTAFKKGAYNYIREETDPLTQQTVPRKYFSGGMRLKPDFGLTSDPKELINDQAMRAHLDLVQVGVAPLKKTTDTVFIGYQLNDKDKKIATEIMEKKTSVNEYDDFGLSMPLGRKKIPVKFYYRPGPIVEEANSPTAPAKSASTTKGKPFPSHNFIFAKMNIEAGVMEIYFSNETILNNFAYLFNGHTRNILYVLFQYIVKINTLMDQGYSLEDASRWADHFMRKKHDEEMKGIFKALEQEKPFGMNIRRRFIEEVRQAIQLRRPVGKAVAMYASARVNSPIARELSGALVKENFSVNGGGALVGGMSDIHEGSWAAREEGKGKTVALPLKLPFEEGAAIAHFVVKFTQFLQRVESFLRIGYVKAVIAFLGGVGTLHETFDAIAKKSDGEINVDMPIIFVDTDKVYQPLYQALLGLEKRGFLNYPVDRLVQLIGPEPSENPRKAMTKAVLRIVKIIKEFDRQVKNIFNSGYELDLNEIDAEFARVYKGFRRIGPTITIVGTKKNFRSLTDTKLGTEYFEQAKKLAYESATAGYSILTEIGEEGSIGDAVRQGFRRAQNEFKRKKRRKFLPFLVDVAYRNPKIAISPSQEIYLNLKYEFLRQAVLLGFGDQGIVYFPGGINTMTLFMDHLDLTGTEKIRHTKAVLVGSEFWGPWLQVLRGLVKKGTVSGWIAEFPRTVETADEARSLIEKGVVGTSDRAALSQPPASDVAQDPGGIDLSDHASVLEIMNGGEKEGIPFDHAMTSSFRDKDFSGLSTRIIRITPLQNPLTVLENG
jgi:predicted Rossmann-fold nucleotide-binding protein